MKMLLPVVLALLPTLVQAHTLSVSHLEVEVAKDGVLDVGLDLAVRDLALTLPLDANGDDQVTWRELRAVRPQLEDLVLEKLVVESGTGACQLSPRLLATRQYEDGMYAHLALSARCPSMTGLRVRYGLFFQLDPQHRVVMTVRKGETVTTTIGREGSSDLALVVTDARSVADFVREGFHHVLIGYDHLAFLISLVLPATLLHQRPTAWRRPSRLHPILTQVLGLVTAFTAAHSITLTLAALGWVTPSSRLVEIAIAASVSLAALNNLRPFVTRRLWLVAFAFGLVHGFGFAGALGELGLPSHNRLLSLLAFNGGVEMGQLAVVALVLPVLLLVRHRDWYAALVVPVASAAIAAMGAFWLISRL